MTEPGSAVVRRIGLVLVIGAVGVLSACSSGGSGSSGSGPTTTSTTTATGAAPCGGADAIEAAVRASDVAGLSSVSDKFNVTSIRIDSIDRMWARFEEAPKPGVTDFQGGYGVARCVSGSWVVYDVGTAEVGCGGGTIPAVPAAVRTDLALGCPTT
jgi:hypothetical protein